MALAGLGAAALLGACATARPEPAVDAAAARGQAFAARQCAGCHAVGLDGFSPRPDAPPFLTLRPAGAERLNWRLETVARVAAVGHYAMPPKTMSPQEIADVAAYLRRLAP